MRLITETGKRGLCAQLWRGREQILFWPLSASLLWASCIRRTGGRAGYAVVYIYNLLNYFALLNIGLGVFNLIPVPPLDGSKVFGILVHDDENYMERRVSRYGYIVFLILAVTGILSIPMGLAQNGIYWVFYFLVRMILHF